MTDRYTERNELERRLRTLCESITVEHDSERFAQLQSEMQTVLDEMTALDRRPK